MSAPGREPFTLGELELDALTELVNIGVSRAASSLGSMVKEQVLLSVPSVMIVSRSDAASRVGEARENLLVAVRQAFYGDISGRALLIFPEKNSLELVRAVVGDQLSLEDILELEHEALTEIGWDGRARCSKGATMVRRLTWCVLAMALVVGPLAGLAGAGGKDKDNPLAAYEKAGKPGPEHKLLEPFVGEWDYTVKMWLKPDSEPMQMTGTVVRKWIFGGRFIHDTVQNEKPNANFKGMGLLGYDNTKKKYTSAWIDSMSTSIHTSMGTVDKDGKVFTFTGTNLDPITRKPVKGRSVMRVAGKDKVVMEESREEGGKWVKVMEITYTRKKK